MGNKVTTDLANEIEKLNEKIGMPSITEMGVTEDMIPQLVAHAATDPSNLTTPRLPSWKNGKNSFLRQCRNSLKNCMINGLVCFHICHE